MDKEILVARRKEAEFTFNDLKKQKEEQQAVISNAQNAVVELDTAMVKLQGRYDELSELINELADTSETVSKEANKIDATEVEGA